MRGAPLEESGMSQKLRVGLPRQMFSHISEWGQCGSRRNFYPFTAGPCNVSLAGSDSFANHQKGGWLWGSHSPHSASIFFFFLILSQNKMTRSLFTYSPKRNYLRKWAISAEKKRALFLEWTRSDNSHSFPLVKTKREIRSHPHGFSWGHC